jgi:lipopolysaccharide export system protein LptC
MESLVEVSGIDTTSNSVVMQSPHISGFEGTRRAYEVKAATAVQNLDDPKLVTFNEISGRFGLDEAGEAMLDAKKGVYDGNRNTLALSEGITVSTNSGYSGSLAGAAIDLGAGTLVSDQPLEFRTAEGSIRAGGVSVAERGKRVMFTGGVSVTYMPPAELITESGRSGDVPAMEPQ